MGLDATDNEFSTQFWLLEKFCSFSCFKTESVKNPKCPISSTHAYVYLFGAQNINYIPTQYYNIASKFV